MMVKFDAYVLWHFAKKYQNWIVDQSIARDFMVCQDSKFSHFYVVDQIFGADTTLVRFISIT